MLFKSLLMHRRTPTSILFILAVALLVALQLTRPSTELTLELDGDSIRYRVQDNIFEGQYRGRDFRGVSIQRSASSVSETAFEWIKVGEEYVLPPARSFFAGGRLHGSFSRIPTILPFRLTFGDWSLDRFDGALEKVSDRSFSAPLRLTAKITGRGAAQLMLHGTSSSLVASIRSGLMDNDLSVCTQNEGCLYTDSYKKPLSASLFSLGNTIISWAFLATIIALCTRCCSWIARRIAHDPRDVSACADCPRVSWSLASVLALFHFCIAYSFASSVLGGVPHIPDSVVYMEQARTLAYGLLDITFPPNLAHEPLYTLGAVDRGSTMTFWYNRFWPFLIAVALRAGFEGFLLPLLSAGTALILFSWSSAIAGRRAALVATAVYCFSPFTITQAGDFMTHVPTSFFILATLELLRQGVSRNRAALFIVAGACGAFALGIRALTTVALGFSALAWFVPLAYAHKQLLRSSFLFVIGACPLLLLLALDNWSITGDALVFPHTRFHSPHAGLQSLRAGAMLMDSQAALLSPILFATPVIGLSLALALLPLVLTPQLRSLNLVLMPLTLLATYHMWPLNGLHGYGPRFLFEATPYLCTLIGLGVIAMWDLIPSRALKAIPLLGFVILFLFNGYVLRSELPTYKGYNSISDRIARNVETISGEKSVVLIEEGGWQMQGYANMWIDPTLSDFVAIRKSSGIPWQDVLKRYSGHKLYSIAHGNLFRIGPSGEAVPFEGTE